MSGWECWEFERGRGSLGILSQFILTKSFRLPHLSNFLLPLPQSLISRLWEVGPQLLYTNRPCPSFPTVGHQISKYELPRGKQRRDTQTGSPDKRKWHKVFSKGSGGTDGGGRSLAHQGQRSEVRPQRKQDPTTGSRKEAGKPVTPCPFSSLALPGHTGLVKAEHVGPWEAAITPGNISWGLGWVGERMWAG